MYRKNALADTMAEVMDMKKKRDDSAAHELRDRPVPPVKGAVTEPEDLRPRPEQTALGSGVSFGDSASMESWM